MKKPRTARQIAAAERNREATRHKSYGPNMACPASLAADDQQQKDLRKNYRKQVKRSVQRLRRWMSAHLTPAEARRQLDEAARFSAYMAPTAQAERRRQQEKEIALRQRAAAAVAEREARWREEQKDEGGKE